MIVDASIAAKWLFQEEYTEQALALAESPGYTGEPLVGPPHLRAEISNVVWKQAKRRGLSAEFAQDRFRRFSTYAVEIAEPAGLYDRALDIAEQFDLDASYDAIYIALAGLLDTELWTDDRRLLDRLGGRAPFVRWIARWA